MLQSIQQMCGDKIGASDGEIGHVRDFYFDDKHWAIRYLVVDTGSWISGRSVLISPHAFKSLYQPGKLMLVHLTRQQIQDSPPVESHKPVTRKYEEAYLGYYGWPYYWLGLGVWGMNNSPTLAQPNLAQSNLAQPNLALPTVQNTLSLPPGQLAGITDLPTNTPPEPVDAHLQSTKDIGSYAVHVGNDEKSESVGEVIDFLMDDQDWVIRHLVIKTGQWADNKTMRVSPDQVMRINTATSQLYLKLSRADLVKASVYQGMSGDERS